MKTTPPPCTERRQGQQWQRRKLIFVSASLIFSKLTFLCLVFRPVHYFMRICCSELCMDRSCAGMGHSISFAAVVLMLLLLLLLLLPLLLLSS